MIEIGQYIKAWRASILIDLATHPWEVTASLHAWLPNLIQKLPAGYVIKDNIAIHKSAVIETGAIIKAPAIVGANVFIGAHAYLRNGVFLDQQVVVGPGCEIKSSVIMQRSALAHFNFVGDSLVGSGVNMEAGSVIANHYNERKEKSIVVVINGKTYNTGVTKFGALVGDDVKIGANAVLSPGTILEPGTVVKRLELVEQTRVQ